MSKSVALMIPFFAYQTLLWNSNGSSSVVSLNKCGEFAIFDQFLISCVMSELCTEIVDQLLTEIYRVTVVHSSCFMYTYVVNIKTVLSKFLASKYILCGWLQPMSVPSDADLMGLSETVRGSYILFEREHKSLVSITFCMLSPIINFTH